MQTHDDDHDTRTSTFGEPTFSERVYRVVRRIPRGRVATYGQVAALAGSPAPPGSSGSRCTPIPNRG